MHKKLNPYKFCSLFNFIFKIFETFMCDVIYENTYNILKCFKSIHHTFASHSSYFNFFHHHNGLHLSIDEPFRLIINKLRLHL